MSDTQWDRSPPCAINPHRPETSCARKTAFGSPVPLLCAHKESARCGNFPTASWLSECLVLATATGPTTSDGRRIRGASDSLFATKALGFVQLTGASTDVVAATIDGYRAFGPLGQLGCAGAQRLRAPRKGWHCGERPHLAALPTRIGYPPGSQGLGSCHDARSRVAPSA